MTTFYCITATSEKHFILTNPLTSCPSLRGSDALHFLFTTSYHMCYSPDKKREKKAIKREIKREIKRQQMTKPRHECNTRPWDRKFVSAAPSSWDPVNPPCTCAKHDEQLLTCFSSRNWVSWWPPMLVRLLTQLHHFCEVASMTLVAVNVSMVRCVFCTLLSTQNGKCFASWWNAVIKQMLIKVKTQLLEENNAFWEGQRCVCF